MGKIKGRPGKKVVQLDFETGEFIDNYKSIFEAAEDNYVTEITLRKALNKSDGFVPSKKLRFAYAE